MVSKEVEKLLLKVQKPGRYVGGELNEVIKDKKKVAAVYLIPVKEVTRILEKKK